jgi:hypothetical protein
MAGFNTDPHCSRRTVLSSALGLGTLGVLGAGLPLASKAAGANKAKSVILIFNGGAPSHIDLWDPKPHATDTVRGPYRPIDTNVTGVQVSELIPRLAQRADKLAIVRSVHHRQSSHNSGMYWTTVGRPYRIDSTLINPSRTDFPCFGTLTGWLAQRNGYQDPLPPYVITPAPHCDSTLYLTPGQFGGCLGSKYDPLVVNADPNSKNFHLPDLGMVAGVDAARVRDRHELLGRLDANGCRLEADGVREFEVNQAKALSMVHSSSASEAFNLSQEPAALREKYGRHSWGQSHLLARRLVERGVRFVTTVNGPSITWDTHKDNFKRMEKNLVPPMEQAFTALLDDLTDRGLLESTIVIWMGDFGRTPIINKDAGRDHWPQCYTAVLAGGGLRTGQVIGESDNIGATPRLRPITPADLHATVFTALGYDPHGTIYHTTDGRPMPLSDGQPIAELL